MNDLDQLKELLFGAEKQALDSITERVGRREVRTADVAEILPEAIHLSHRKNSELVDSLSQPVGECLQKAFRDEPETYSDALYPVIGPAIRKSIMHALRTFSQQISEAVENSITPKGLKWRWQASRAGVPFGEFLLQKTLQYRVEQAYLISRENGLLVDHVHHEASKIKDSDAVSAMFTAIQDFVKESFSPDRTGRLESADMGEFTLWAVHGPHALLVCVIRGVPPRSLRADLTAILERIHFRYGEAIRDYKGDTSTIPDVAVELERCLRFEARADSARKRRGPSPVIVVLLLLLVAAALFLAFRSFTYAQQLEKFRNALEATPGIHVTHVSQSGGRFTVRALKDPLATSVTDIAADVGIEPGRVEAATEPFQSLQPAIIAARAAQMFGQPETVQFDVSGPTLLVSGEASLDWQRRLESRFAALAGVDVLDTTGLSTTGSGGAERFEEPFAEPFADRVAELDGQKFFFEEGTRFATGAEDELRSYASRLRELVEDAAAAGYSVSVDIVGATDSSGEPAANAVLADRRGRAVAGVLSESGVVGRVIGRPARPPSGGPVQADPAQRHAEIQLELRQLPAQP